MVLSLHDRRIPSPSDPSGRVRLPGASRRLARVFATAIEDYGAVAGRGHRSGKEGTVRLRQGGAPQAALPGASCEPDLWTVLRLPRIRPRLARLDSRAGRDGHVGDVRTFEGVRYAGRPIRLPERSHAGVSGRNGSCG